LNKLKSLDRSSIIYIDESGMNDNDYYPYVYSPIGQRYYESHPGHYTKRISMIAGLCGRNLQAPFMFEGHCNTATFDTYIEKILLPTLKSGMTIIIDNASFHKSAKTKQLIEEAGCFLMFLPAYSPDLNPIEHYWHKIKTLIRKLKRNLKISLESAMEKILDKETIY
jgi:putative transposase